MNNKPNLKDEKDWDEWVECQACGDEFKTKTFAVVCKECRKELYG